MEIADRDDEPRRAFVDRSFGSEASTLRAALADRFALRFFKFSSATERLNDLGDLGYAGSRTDLGQALSRVRDELAGVPLSGIVVVSDGADNSESVLTDSLRALGADGVPVYTVGLGREAFERDIQVSRVETPRSVLLGHLTRRRRRHRPGRLRRDDDRRAGRGRGTHRQHRGGRASSQRRTGDGAHAIHRDRGGAAYPPLQRATAARRDGHAEQRARRTGRGRGPSREDPVLRGRAALRGEVHSARRGRRRQPAARRAAADSRQQVPAPRHRRRRRPGRWLPEDARGAVPVPRAHAG